MRQFEKRVKDRRVQKTQNLLREALASLIREKDYDSIVLQEILDRANVGRSTFYSHFRDKDELLVSAIHDMLGPVQAAEPPSSAKPYEEIIWFSLPIFEYLDRHRRASLARMGTRGRAILHEHLRKVLVTLVADRFGKGSRGRRRGPPKVPQDLLAKYVASTFILVLNWWVEGRSSRPPQDINDLFRALILPTLVARSE